MIHGSVGKKGVIECHHGINVRRAPGAVHELRRPRDRFPLPTPRRQCGVITRSGMRFPPPAPVDRSASVNAVNRWASEIRSTSIAIESTAWTRWVDVFAQSVRAALSHLRTQRTFPRAHPQDGEHHRRGEQGGRCDEEEIEEIFVGEHGNRPCPWWRVERARPNTLRSAPAASCGGHSQTDRVGGNHTHTRRRCPSRSRLSAHGMIVRRRRAPVLLELDPDGARLRPIRAGIDPLDVLNEGSARQRTRTG